MILANRSELNPLSATLALFGAAIVCLPLAYLAVYFLTARIKLREGSVLLIAPLRPPVTVDVGKIASFRKVGYAASMEKGIFQYRYEIWTHEAEPLRTLQSAIWSDTALMQLGQAAGLKLEWRDRARQWIVPRHPEKHTRS